MVLFERVKWIREHMKEPQIIVRGSEFDEVETALEKQIPKKAVDVLGEKCCPVCKTIVEYKVKTKQEESWFWAKDEYCSECGQKIDTKGD